MSIQPPIEFVALWSANSRRVYAYIYSLVANWADADDIFQETSITLVQKFDDFTPGTSFAAWACRVAYHKVLEFQRRNRLLEHLDEDYLDMMEPLAASFAEKQGPRLETLETCLEKLSPKDRRLVELRYREDAPVAVVAEKLGRTTSLVYKSLARVHELLLDCIRRNLAKGERS